ncbi:MAG: lactonase family protein [Eubacteriales bacterium]|nr:lactonase family protein [Eubacteriales bacterium]
MKERTILVGSYAKEQEQGIHIFRLETNPWRLEPAGGQGGISNPSYLAVSADGRNVYAVMEDMEYEGQFGGGVASFKWQENRLIPLNKKPTGGTLPCHLLPDQSGRALYVSNYMSGSLSMFRLEPDGSLSDRTDLDQHTGHGPNPERQEGPHVHFAGFEEQGTKLYCSDLGLDRLCCYRPDPVLGHLGRCPEEDIAMPGGVGPRHFAVLPSHPGWLYAVGELSSELYAVEQKSGRIAQRLSTRESFAKSNTCAAIKASPDGKYLYISNRGDDSIAVFAVGNAPDALTRIQCMPAGGRTPRDLLVLEDAVLAANQDSDSISVFSRDPETGLLSGPVLCRDCPSPVCLVEGSLVKA